MKDHPMTTSDEARALETIAQQFDKVGQKYVAQRVRDKEWHTVSISKAISAMLAFASTPSAEG